MAYWSLIGYLTRGHKVSKLHVLVDAVTTSYDKFFYNDVAREMYIEASKAHLYQSEDQALASTSQAVLLYVFENILKMLHPFMPFVTEELTSSLEGDTVTWLDIDRKEKKTPITPVIALAMGQLTNEWRWSRCINGSADQDVCVNKIANDALPCEYNTICRVQPILMKVNGFLEVLCHDRVVESNEMDIWMLKDYEERVWIKETFVFGDSWVDLDGPFPLECVNVDEIAFLLKRVSKDMIRIAADSYNFERMLKRTFQPSSVEIMLFELSSFEWRKIDAEIPVDISEENWNEILAFDLRTKMFVLIKIPNDALPCEYNTICRVQPILMKVNGFLEVLCHDRVVESNEMDIWMLKDYEERVWIKETFVFGDSWVDLDGPFPLECVNVDEIAFLLKRVSKDMIRVPVYDMKTRSFVLNRLSTFLVDTFYALGRLSSIKLGVMFKEFCL
ncbi:F-box domain-containing protein [Artemisia annua]|uniref:F-box domain-containing protein n=1 Tax=Artemisia annua TaxID=35608 RepID=A0A2U1QCT7_ARTAN|nr:F-box domain-containing protein [Artemisia annua]